jgi:hypothetical protein
MVMTKNLIARILGGVIIFTLLASSGSFAVQAQDPAVNGVQVASNTASVGAPVQTKPVLLAEAPVLTAEQIARQQWSEENMHRSAPLPATTGTVAGPVPGSETVAKDIRPRSGQPLAPADPATFIWTQYGSVIPAGYKSNVMESSTDGKSSRIFATGNWFAANSVNKGQTFSYINPYADYTDFCCDQVALHDVTRDIYLWFRLASPNASGVNTFKLSVDFAAPFNTGYSTYTFSPTSVNAAWTGQWFDYPHMVVGADYLYIALNMFNAAGSWTRTLMLRFPLDALAASAGFSYNYYEQSTFFTFLPVSGASHTMYFASNWGTTTDSLRIWRWNEDAAGLTFWDRTVPAWTATGRGSMVCGSPNWLARGDQRLTAGALYSVNSDNSGGSIPRSYGRKVLGWWWDVAQGSGFTYPYIEGAAFYEDTMTLLPGLEGRPFFWGSGCFAYASLAPNRRGDLGGVFNYASPSALQIPNVYYTIADDFVLAPPGWTIYGAAGGSAGASDVKWGDYNTTRAYQLGSTWLGASHFIPTATNCSNCSVPLWLGFGRERDRVDFSWW